MKQVAKLIMVDKDDDYLIMHRSDHPTFGQDADLPGGTGEDGESMIDTVRREVLEETGVVVGDVEEIYSGLGYSYRDTKKSLYLSRFEERP